MKSELELVTADGDDQGGAELDPAGPEGPVPAVNLLLLVPGNSDVMTRTSWAEGENIKPDHKTNRHHQ